MTLDAQQDASLHLGRLACLARTMRGHTHRQIAELTGTNPNNIGRAEKAAAGKHLQDVMSAYGISPLEFALLVLLWTNQPCCDRPGHGPVWLGPPQATTDVQDLFRQLASEDLDAAKRIFRHLATDHHREFDVRGWDTGLLDRLESA